MENLLYLPIALLLIMASPGICQEVIYVFSNDMNFTIENSTISDYNASKIIYYTLKSSSVSPNSTEGDLGISLASAGELRQIFEDRMDLDNTVVLDEATSLGQRFPGDHCIDQVCVVYDHLRSKWNYTSDPTHREHFRYANQTLVLGRRINLAGAGDCDDFAIFMAAMIEGLGGSARIVSSWGPMGGHAYAEVYLGKPGNDTWKLIKWIKEKYRADDIKASIDFSKDEVWLNLDWYVRHPGGAQSQATDGVIVYTRDEGELIPLCPPNDLPVAAISYDPTVPNVGEPVTFDGSRSTDDGKIELYQWDFGDGGSIIREEPSYDHPYSVAGTYEVSLTVTDDKRARNKTISTITINQPPSAVFSYLPQEPVVNESVFFDPSDSIDSDGSIKKCEWDFGGAKIISLIADRVETKYSDIGAHIVNLTVIDDKNAINTCSQKIIVRPRGAWISNFNESDEVAQYSTVIGEYAPANSNEKIWVFVKSIYDRKYWPQSENASIGDSAIKVDGKWEMRIRIGEDYQVDSPFEISVGTANLEADRNLRKLQKEWYDNGSYPGIRDLPAGVTITDRVNVTRSQEIFDRILNISNVNLPGNLNITDIVPEKHGLQVSFVSSMLTSDASEELSDGFQVDQVSLVSGEFTPDVRESKIWILLYSPNGRWYPQSMDPLNGSHVEMINGKWYGKIYCTGKSGDPFDFVVVLADAKANRILDEKQRLWASRLNNKGERGDFPGLKTIELPLGIDEKYRIRVILIKSLIGISTAWMNSTLTKGLYKGTQYIQSIQIGPNSSLLPPLFSAQKI